MINIRLMESLEDINKYVVLCVYTLYNKMGVLFVKVLFLISFVNSLLIECLKSFCANIYI